MDNLVFTYDEDSAIRIYDGNTIVAEVIITPKDGNIYDISHTWVDDSLRGQGIAQKLVERAVEYIEQRNGYIEASCSFANAWLEKNK